MPCIRSYVVTHDYGFAPNPFCGFLTLATCKPVIRRTAVVGDWLVGTASARSGHQNKVIYVAKIDKTPSIAEYGADPAYSSKRPSHSRGEESRHGDNIYYQDNASEWHQRKNIHHGSEHTRHDLSGGNVLIANKFWYFGSNPQSLPKDLLHIVKKGPGHKCERSPDIIFRLEKWLEQFRTGIFARPVAHSGSNCTPC